MPKVIPLGEACVVFQAPCDPQSDVQQLLTIFNEINDGTLPNHPFLVAGLDLTQSVTIIDANGNPVPNDNVVLMALSDPSLSSSQDNSAVLGLPAIVGIVVVVVVVLAAVVIAIVFFRRRSSGDIPMEIV
jgi:hypothetical protein